VVSDSIRSLFRSGRSDPQQVERCGAGYVRGSDGDRPFSIGERTAHVQRIGGAVRTVAGDDVIAIVRRPGRRVVRKSTLRSLAALNRYRPSLHKHTGTADVS